ncbi:FAD-dependent oxidoreductase [Kribbella shirazensis]|uniref:FAD-dependent oxidoreductase n=1 Tax=Kribbella shirazensis TaxID=1105143 RepID=A0A7X5V5T2_9ACTN|nr:FAD-dependent oxidoreductase [Kribbella shirazensis]NIK54706.1 hypothetical protein [Kribbella shirazensis]
MTVESKADLVIVGGGLGGVAAALTAARLGRTVIMTEASDWLGGQLTTQGVPPDENAWIEEYAGSASYRDLRTRVRDHYRRNYPLSAAGKSDPALNPGRGFVSRVCHEPRVGALVLAELVSSLQADGRLTVLYEHEPVAADRDGSRVTAVVVRDRRSGVERRLTGAYVVDATELGDLLELADVPHVVGAESKAETGELHAVDEADPRDQQAISWCFAVEYRPGENHTIEKPARYEYWRDQVDPRWPNSQLSWTDVHPITLETRTRPIFSGAPDQGIGHDGRDLWQYRRILARATFDDRFTGGEVSLVNWPQIDYWELPIVGVSEAERQHALEEARQLSLSFLYWMQTEAPRAEGGAGYPELRLRGDVLGTADGLAKEAYIRESRRIKAAFTVTEEHIGVAMRGTEAGAAEFDDSVGIGHYRIDLHPSTAGRNYVDIECFPFQIPLGALIPADVDNLLPANKNIGTTHITNGAYRLHPVEWSIGEAVGATVAQCLDRGLTPLELRSDAHELRKLQDLLSGELGVALTWPESVRLHRG